MNDLTVLMLTANRVPEEWFSFYRQKLEEATCGAPIITFSYRPLNWGEINVIQKEHSTENIYRQMLFGARKAKTPYIAIADDDTLYPKEHFSFRPPLDKFAYNLNRWHVNLWCYPIFHYCGIPGNGLMIASRELVVKALKNRIDAGVVNLRELGTLKRKAFHLDCGEWLRFYTSIPVISFQHIGSVDRKTRKMTKKFNPVMAYDLPGWGTAEEVNSLWKGVWRRRERKN